MPNLFSLFDDSLKSQDDTVAANPQSLESISDQADEQEYILRKIKQFDEVKSKVDYSDFKNFVFFNSALDYFNISGEKILNEYPYDGSLEYVEAYLADLDEYQKYLIGIWPKSSGHISFKPSVSFSYVTVEDYGIEEGTVRTSLMSPGTGSWTVEFWCVPPPSLTGSDDIMVVAQKVSGSNLDGYTVFYSGSNVYFNFTSGSTTDQIFAPFIPGQITHFSCILNRESSVGSISIATGSVIQFPVIVNSANANITGPVNLGSERFYIGSGSVVGKVTLPMTGALDNVRLWNDNRTLIDLTSSFNSRIQAQKNLVGLWKFSESGSIIGASAQNAIVLDYSGHRLNGRIENYDTQLRVSGSLTPYETPDLILSFDAPEVMNLVNEQQTSGSAYDRSNDNIITRLLPEEFFLMEEYKNTKVLERFLYVLARQFDFTKTKIDQFTNVLRTHYGSHNQTPDALLAEVGRFFGWEFTGNFLNANTFQYILGKNVLQSVESNKELDVKLYQIKNEFWRRTLNNLIYIYKTKGTRESVEALLRVYGVNKNFVRLKEYGYKKNVGIETYRISAEKSVPALAFGSGTVSGTNYVRSQDFDSIAKSIEARVRFPTTSTADLVSTVLTGSIWTMNSASLTNDLVYQLNFAKNGATSTTGTLQFLSSEGNITLQDVSIFDNKWYNISVVRNEISSSLTLDVRSVDKRDVSVRLSASISSNSIVSSSRPFSLWLGSTGSMQSQYWMQEVRVWNGILNNKELDDHTLNFQSYGTENLLIEPDISLHWRLNENVTGSSLGQLDGDIIDVSGKNITGIGYGFLPEDNSYKKFLNDYNYIASFDFGWNEEKIRSFASNKVPKHDEFADNQILALEFNMIDALNEDITQIMAAMDGFNNVIGLPANRYRGTYHDLETLRDNYFKRLQGTLNFRLFFDMLEFFDRSFISMIRKIVPARAIFLGDEFVVESHMLERPKLQWNYRRQDVPFEPEGVIKVFVRT